MKPEIKALIDERVKSEVEVLIYNVVTEAKAELQAMMKERIDLIAGEIVRTTTNEVFENSIKEEVIRRYDMIQKVIEDEMKESE